MKKIVSQCSFLKPLRICVWNSQILKIGLQNIIQRKREANSGCTFSFVLFNISGEKEEYEQLFKRFSWHTQKNPKNPIKLHNYDWINRRFIVLLQEKYSRGGKTLKYQKYQNVFLLIKFRALKLLWNRSVEKPLNMFTVFFHSENPGTLGIKLESQTWKEPWDLYGIHPSYF